MCGIAGQARSDGTAVDGDLLEAMCAGLEHRGPDSRGIHLDGPVGLGIQRLRVIDLATGDQPVYNEDRSVAVVLNGEIYNYRELRERLRSNGHRFRSDGDTEVIAHLYEEEGPDFVRSLAGMFGAGALGRPAPGAVRRPRPDRQEAAVLRRAGRRHLLRLGALGAAGRRRHLARGRSGCARSLLHLHLRARVRTAPSAPSASCRPARCCAGRPAGPGSSVTGSRTSAPKLRDRLRGRGGGDRSRRRSRGGPAPAGRRRPARRLPLRRGRLDRGAGGDGRALERARQDLLDRLRGGRLRRAALRPRDRRALRRRAPRARGPPGRGRAAAED